MHPLVPRQAALVIRAIVAMSTLKGLLPSVQPQVRRQVALDTRAEVAMSTLKGLLPSVHPQVRRQVALVTSAVVAMSTLKGLLSSVHPQVHRQAALVTRAVVAMSTLKGLLSSVHPQVPRQAALVTRAIVAMSTLKGLLPIVQPQVPRQAAHLGGLIPTVLALVDHHLFLSEVRSCRTTDVPATDEPPLGLPLMVLIKRAVQLQWPADRCLVLAQHLSLSAHRPSFLLITCPSLVTSHRPLRALGDFQLPFFTVFVWWC
jgi:hypothetical protein